MESLAQMRETTLTDDDGVCAFESVRGSHSIQWLNKRVWKFAKVNGNLA